METVPRKVILDLLPAYLAGEASEGSRALGDAYAQSYAGVIILSAFFAGLLTISVALFRRASETTPHAKR